MTIYIPTDGATLLTVALLIGIIFTACDGPAGSEGPQGPQGEVGPVGPAGEDGSVMYAGTDAPTADIGQDRQDGADGQDGVDGQDGEDGSQILSGDSAPTVFDGTTGDFYLDKTNFDLYGPKSPPPPGAIFGSWGTPINIKGAEGNANVTQYIFPGHDFSADDNVSVTISGVNNPEESAWFVYFKSSLGTTYNLPGYGTAGNTYYRTYRIGVDVTISVVDGPGEYYGQIEVIRIEASNTEDHTKRVSGDSITPDHLDTSNYEEVADYYGF